MNCLLNLFFIIKYRNIAQNSVIPKIKKRILITNPTIKEAKANHLKLFSAFIPLIKKYRLNRIKGNWIGSSSGEYEILLRNNGSFEKIATGTRANNEFFIIIFAIKKHVIRENANRGKMRVRALSKSKIEKAIIYLPIGG